MVLFAVRKRCVRGCCLWHRGKVSARVGSVRFFTERTTHPLHEYLHHFIVACNTIASAALCELALVILRGRTDQFSWWFMPVAVRLCNLLPSNVFSGCTLGSFMRAINYCLQRVYLIFPYFYFGFFLQFYSLPGIMVLYPFYFTGGVSFPSSMFPVNLIIIIT